MAYNAADYINIKDFDKLVEDLKKVGKITDAEVQSAITPVATELANKLKAASPTKDIANAMGQLHKKAQYPRSIYVGALRSRGKGHKLAWIFEYGTKERSYKHKDGLIHKTGAIKPRFYFRNTITANQSKLATDLLNNLFKIVQNKLKK